MSRGEGQSGESEQDAVQAKTESHCPEALCRLGFRFREEGRRLDAIKRCQEVFLIDPNYADAHYLMALLSLDEGQNDLAIEWSARAIHQNPRAEYLRHFGASLQKLKHFEEAEKAFDEAVQFQPDSVELWCGLGHVLLQLNRGDLALPCYQRALQLKPHDFEAASKGGALLLRQGRWAEALVRLNTCLELQPDHAAILNLRGIAHQAVGNYEAYLSDSQRAHAVDPADPEICNNVGAALVSLGRAKEAIAWFDKGLALAPNKATILTNKALAMSECLRLEEAAVIYAQVRTLAPDLAIAELGLSFLNLLRGDFAAGWVGREARWKIPSLSSQYPRFQQPMWRGEERVEGKTILIHVDEGLGDTIQYARYVPMVAARGARIILVVPDPLQSLMAGLDGVELCLPLSVGELPDFDLHCSFSSLPLVFGTTRDTIPARASYLPRPPAERVRVWEERLGPRTRPRIGLVWSGNIAHKNDHNRSVPMRMLAHLLDLDATFVSLQKDARSADRVALAERSEILDLTVHLTEFTETAALVSCLDLVITVDTSVAHLAGALGHPTWVILPFMPDYRWMLDRADSPWYPTMRLFRQNECRDYAPVLDRIRAELSKRLLEMELNLNAAVT